MSDFTTIDGVASSDTIKTTREEKAQFARAMVEQLESQIKAGNSTIQSTATDGVSVTFSRKEAIEELSYWKKQAYQLARRGSRMSSFDISGA